MGQEKALPWKNWEVVKLIGKGTYGDYPICCQSGIESNSRIA